MEAVRSLALGTAVALAAISLQGCRKHALGPEDAVASLVCSEAISRSIAEVERRSGAGLGKACEEIADKLCHERKLLSRARGEGTAVDKASITMFCLGTGANSIADGVEQSRGQETEACMKLVAREARGAEAPHRDNYFTLAKKAAGKYKVDEARVRAGIVEAIDEAKKQTKLHVKRLQWRHGAETRAQHRAGGGQEGGSDRGERFDADAEAAGEDRPCKLSEWEEWSECMLGTKYRKRQVLREGSKPCGEELLGSRRCGTAAPEGKFSSAGPAVARAARTTDRSGLVLLAGAASVAGAAALWALGQARGARSARCGTGLGGGGASGPFMGPLE